jgi:hypothetical protein
MNSDSEMNSNLSESLNILTTRINKLTEVITGFAELKELLLEQAENSKRQEQSISRLVDMIAHQLEIIDV